MAAWYKCSSCQVLIQGIQQFVVHNYKHQFKDDDDNDTTVQSGGQLFYPEPGVGYPLNELPSQHTTGIFAPRIQLMSIEESYANFMVEIKSPSVLLPFVGTGEPELRLPLVPDYTTLDSYDKNDLDRSKDELPQTQIAKRVFVCNFCHHQVTSSKSLSSHIQECLKGPNASRLYCCPIDSCDYSRGFCSTDLIWSHFSNYHQVQARSTCDNCQQAFPTASALGHHQTDTTCVTRTVSEMKEELDVIKRLSGKIERVPMVYCSFCQLRLKKRVLSGHHLTCHKKLLHDGRSIQFRCPFSQCPAMFNSRSEVALHFHSSCHSHVNIDVRNMLTLKLQRKMELLNYTQCDVVGIVVPKNRRKRTVKEKETRSTPPESDPNGGYPFKLYHEKNGKIRKILYKPCRTCGRVISSRNLAKHQRECMENREISKGFASAALKSRDIRSFFKSKTQIKKPENGELKLDNDSGSSRVPVQSPIVVKQEIDPGVNVVEDSKQTSTKVVSVVKAGLTSTKTRVKPEKYKRREQMKQCPFCCVQIRPSNFVRHCRRCKRISRISKNQNMTRPCTTVEKQLPSIKVESTHDEPEQETTNFDQEKVSDLFEETSPEDLNSFGKKEMNVMDQDDEKVPTVSSHSRKKIASLRAKARGKIQIQFKTRCRYCDIQITSKCLAKHLSRCKVKKRIDQERNTVMAEKERDVTIIHTQTVVEQNSEAKQSQDSPSWLANWTDCTILTDSKFRPRSTCPICKTVQTSGSLTTHMQKCALNSPIVTSSPKNESQQPEEIFHPVTDREDSEQKQSTSTSSNLETTQVTEETKTKKPSVPNNKQLKKCPACRRFVRADNMDEHHRNRCGRVKPKCDVPCPKPGCKTRLTSNPFSLNVHLRVHHNANQTCGICNRTFTVKASFRKHFYGSICGRSLMPIGSEQKKASAGRNSVIASRKILATSKLRIGKAKVQPEIDSSRIITANVQKNEPSQQLILGPFERIPCQECGTVMFRKSILKHLRVCKGRKNVEPEVEISQTSLMVCTEMGCDSLFLSSEELKNHVEQYHVKKVNYLCSNCKKLFVETLSNISQHRKTCQSVGTKPYLASSSIETVVRPGQLKRVAIKIVSDTSTTPTLLPKPKPKPPSPKKTKFMPTNLKPNECNMCGNCYNTASGLQQHKQRHCGKKSASAASQWKCIFCMQGFVTPADLKDHIRNRCHLRRSDGNTMEHDPLTLPMTSETSNGFANDAGSTSDMKCGYCHTYFSTRKALMEHFRTPCTLPSNGVSHGQIKMDPDGIGAVRIKMEDDLMVDGIMGAEVEQDPLDDESIY